MIRVLKNEANFIYRISSNKRRVSNKRRPLISHILGIHIEISAAPLNTTLIRITELFWLPC